MTAPKCSLMICNQMLKMFPYDMQSNVKKRCFAQISLLPLVSGKPGLFNVKIAEWCRSWISFFNDVWQERYLCLSLWIFWLIRGNESYYLVWAFNFHLFFGFDLIVLIVKKTWIHINMICRMSLLLNLHGSI